MRLNACDVADVAHLFDLTSGMMQPMLDSASKSCVGGHGGFDEAINTDRGDGPGFAQETAGSHVGRVSFHVMLHRLLGCSNIAAEGVQLLCPCMPDTPADAQVTV